MKYYVPHPRMFGLLWYVMHGEIIGNYILDSLKLFDYTCFHQQHKPSPGGSRRSNRSTSWQHSNLGLTPQLAKSASTSPAWLVRLPQKSSRSLGLPTNSLSNTTSAFRFLKVSTRARTICSIVLRKRSTKLMVPASRHLKKSWLSFNSPEK